MSGARGHALRLVTESLSTQSSLVVNLVQAHEPTEAIVTCFLGNFKGDLASEDIADPTPETGFMVGGNDPSLPSSPSTEQVRLYPGWEVTAGGPRPRACGQDQVQLFCETCGHWFKVDSTCRERTCPVCGVVWSFKQAVIMAHRLIELGRTPQARGAWGREAIVSPPRNQWPRLLEDDQYVRYKRAQVADLARRCGFRGCSVIFHPYRDTDERGHYDIEGPHFHVVGWADRLEPLSQVSTRMVAGGWIFKGTAAKDGRAHRLKSWAQFYNKCQYELSHCGIIDGMHAFTWYGICNPKVVPLTEKERAFRRRAVGHPCPKCGSLWTTPLELVRPDAEMERQPYVGHRGQTRFKQGTPIRWRH